MPKSQYNTDVRPVWCPGCGDYGIMTAMVQAFDTLGLEPHQVAIVSGIGCGSKLPDYVNAYGYMSIHGRPLPVATGIKIANPHLTVVVVDGDGDAYGIGGNHLIHTARRNADIAHIVQNNQIYALTKGQFSPTTDRGVRTTTSPAGKAEEPIRPLALALAAGATFAARGAAYDPKLTSDLIVEAIRHPGYAILDVLQPCVTFNKGNTYAWYRERTYNVADSGHDPENLESALALAVQWGERIPLGVIYRRAATPHHLTLGGLEHGSLSARPIDELGREGFESLVNSFL